MVTINSGSDVAGEVGARFGRRFGAGFILFVLMIGAGVVLFWDGFFALFAAWTKPEYSHGLLIPVLSLYLFLRQLRATAPPPSPASDRWPGVGVVIFALLIALIGNVTHIPDIVTYAMVLWLYGVLLVGFGWRDGRKYWPPVLNLVFMLPLPGIIQWQLSINLQFISSEIGVALIRLMNIPVFLEANFIDLGVYKLHVKEASSGLRYLFPVMSFSYIFAVLYQGPIWHKAVLLLSAAPITVLMSSFRIGMIGVLVNEYGSEQAEVFLHSFEGWVILISCVLILFGMARLMQKVAGDRRSLSKALDLEFGGLGGQAARIFSIRASAALAVIMALTVIAGPGWRLAPERQIADVKRDPFVLFPRLVGDWRSGPAQQLDANVARTLGTDDYHSVAFRAPGEAAPVDLLITYYERQTKGDGIHSPDVCIPAGGWEMSRITQASIEFEGADGVSERFSVNRAVIQKGFSAQLVYYWFEERGRRLTSNYVTKAMTVIDALTMGRTDGGLVRVITPIGRGEAEEAADARLQSFLDDMLKILPRFIPD